METCLVILASLPTKDLLLKEIFSFLVYLLKKFLSKLLEQNIVYFSITTPSQVVTMT